MSGNRSLQRIFDQLAAGIELLGGNSYRASSHRRVARVLRGLTDDVAALVEGDRETAVRRLTALPGIGKGAAARILEFLETGRIAEHERLLEQVPSGVFELLEIPGIGPKGARSLWRDLGVDSVDALRALLDQDAVAGVPRLGQRTVENLREALGFRAETEGRTPIGVALPLALALCERLRGVEGVARIAFAGSLRRGVDTVGDLDLLATCADPGLLRDAFLAMPEVERVLASGEHRCSVRVRADAAGGGRALQVDLRMVPASSWGAALLYFTGSKEHNVLLRERAIRRGQLLNEYGLFEAAAARPQDMGGTEGAAGDRPQDSGEAPIAAAGAGPPVRGETPLAAAEEADVYRALGLPFVPPELREEGIDPASVPSDLIELGDVRAELHAHTTASDGKLTIRQLAEAAKARGYHTLAITDHSASSVIANGLSAERLRRHADAVREEDARIRGIRLLAGAEVDVLPDGRLDYDDDVLAELDIVVASPHASLRQGREAATRRLVAAASHPLVHVVGHPTGRVVGRRAGLEPDLERLFAAAAESATALELNANPRRLDLCDRHVRAAVAAGCVIALDTDAHSDRSFDFLPYGVMTARRAGLKRDACINTWSRARLERWLRRKR